MADATPIYGFRYQELDDPPDGAGLGQLLAEDVETELIRVENRITVNSNRLTTVEAEVDANTAAIAALGQTVLYDTPEATGAGANANHTGTNGVTVVIASITVADPGFTYRIAGRAGMRMTEVTSDLGFVSHSGALMVDTTTMPSISAATTNSTVSAAFLEITGADALPTIGFLNLPYRRARNTYTGQHTVNFLYMPGAQGTVSWGPLNNQADYYFELDIIPA